MIFNFAYECVLWIYALCVFPKLLYQRLFYQKYRKSFFQRLGRSFPAIDRGRKFVIWIHAVSMGETKAISSLARMLKQHHPNALFIISSITETGHAEAKRCMSFADHHLYLPFDLNVIIKPIIQKLKPDLVILCETDFWYNFLRHCKKEGAKIALVNGKVSERSKGRYQFWRCFSLRLFSQFDVLCVQNALYQKRFNDIGIPNEKIVITGNLKFDDEYPHFSSTELLAWKMKFNIRHNDQVLVIGSTHYPEEQLILKKLQQLWKVHPQLKVFLVPRHPDRFHEVADLIEQHNISFQRYSMLDEKKELVSVPLILVDAMGILRQCYQLAHVAVIGGSFTPKVGGHNILEPCWYGVPVVFGPYMHAQTELVELARQYNAGLQVSLDEFYNMIHLLLKDESKRIEMGKAGLKLAMDNQGASKRTFEYLEALNNILNKK